MMKYWMATLLLAMSSGTSMAGVVDLPRPDLSALEQIVRQRLGVARVELDTLLAGDVGDAERAAAIGDMGRLYQAHHLDDLALACYQVAGDLAPGEFRWAYLAGMVSQRAHGLDEAVAAYQRALTIRPNDTAARLRLAQVYLERNQPQAAEPLFKAALAHEGLEAAAAYGLGKAALSRREYQAAVDWLERALRLQPEASQLRYPLAMAYRGLGDRERAKQNLALKGGREPEVRDPLMDAVNELAHSARGYVQTGWQAMGEERFGAAAEAFGEAVELEPGNLATRVALARALYEIGDKQAARGHLEETVRLSPEDALGNVYLGLLEVEAGDRARAEKLFRRALATSPEMPMAHFELAKLLLDAERFDEAAAHFRKLVENAPDHVEARLLEARTLAQTAAGDRMARLRLEEGVAAYPEDADLVRALVKVLAASPDSAVRDADRAVALALPVYEQAPLPENAEAMAMALAGQGEFERAVSIQEYAFAVAMNLGRFDLVPRLEVNLRLYEAGQPCRNPWGITPPARAVTAGATAIGAVE